MSHINMPAEQHIYSYVATLPGVKTTNVNQILAAISNLRLAYITYIFKEIGESSVLDGQFVYIFGKYMTAPGFKDPDADKNLLIGLSSEKHVKIAFSAVKKLIPDINEEELVDFILERKLWKAPYGS